MWHSILRLSFTYYNAVVQLVVSICHVICYDYRFSTSVELAEACAISIVVG